MKNVSKIKPKRLFLHALVLVISFSSTSAMSLPNIFDQWQFFCNKKKITNSLVEKLKDKASEENGNLKTGIALLNYACVLYAQENKSFEKKLKKFQNKGSKGRQPTPYHKSSISYIKSASLRLASAAKVKKPSPSALYNYGLALALTGNAATVNVFDQLMINYKKSKDTPKAYLSLGDFYLDKQQVANAQREYKQAMSLGSKLVKSYANYKNLWIKFAIAIDAKKVMDQRKIVAEFASVVQALQSGSSKEKRLARIISDDIYNMLSAIGNLEEAKRILTRIKQKKRIAEIMEQFAYNNINSGKPKNGYNMLLKVVAERPYHPLNYEIHATLINLAAQLENVPLLISNLKVMIKTYVLKSKWKNKQKSKTKKLAYLKTEALLFEYPTVLFQEGSAKKNNNFLKGASQLYPLYLKYFPKNKRAYDIQFYYAQLLFQMNKFQKSANALLTMIKKKPKGKHTKEAADIMVTAAQSAIDADKDKFTIPELGTIKRKIKLPYSKKLYIDCLDAYLKYLPKNENTVAMHYASSSTYYEFGHYITAYKRYSKLIKLAPKSEFANFAAVRVLTAFQNTKDDSRFLKARKLIGKYRNLKTNPDIAPFFKIKMKDTGSGSNEDDEQEDQQEDQQEDDQQENQNNEDEE